jgi:hypothetical protein
MIYVSLIYVSMKKQASKQAKKSICEWGDPRSGQAVSIVPSYHH